MVSPTATWCPPGSPATRPPAPLESGRSPEEHIRDAKTAYAGKVSLVDKWIGHLLDAVKETGHLGDTVIVFTSDHGAMLGEQNEVHKGATRLRNQCPGGCLF